MSLLLPARRISIWHALWALLAILHVTQSIWLTKFDAYPGGLGDGRFNQLVLEHGHQSLKGIYRWDSLGEFYPAAGTIAYSDTHAGTLPIYTAVRRLSISREEAWQLWFIIVAALNVWATFRLCRALEVGAVLRGPLVFASAGSATMVWLAGTHMQMLPVFPTLLAWEQMVLFRRDRQGWRLLTVAGCVGWQFAAGPYIAFFATVITALSWAVVRLVRPAADDHVVPAPEFGRLARIGCVAGCVAGVGLGLLVLRVYLFGLRQGHGRGLSEVIDLAPMIGSWFTASPAHFFFPAGWPGGQLNLNEHAWLSGFLPWAFAIAALSVSFRSRTSAASWALVFAGGGLATALFFTRWSTEYNGAWVWLAERIESLRAFRAAGRCAVLLQFLLVGAAGLLLTDWHARAKRSWIRIACLAAAILLALENFSDYQPHTLRETARSRARAVIAAWERAGDRPVLAYAPQRITDPVAWLHLDAWSAALEKHRVTLNGYSGGAPLTHWDFLVSPTPETVTLVATRLGLPEDQISVVESLEPPSNGAIGAAER